MLIIIKRNEPEDIEFMHKCHEVDEHKPSTWSKYPNNIDGANAKNMKEWEENLYHLSVACLHAWRLYNGR